MTTQKYIDIAGSMFVPTVVLVDSSGVPYTASGGGGSGGGLSDTILTDDSNTQFLARDNGTTITYVTLSGVAYTPSTNIRALSVTVTGASTSAKQDTGNTSLAALVANTPAANADGGSPAHITNFPASQAVTGTFYQATQPISGGTSLVDGVTSSLKATVAAFHNSDNQSLGSTSYGLNTGGVAQLLNSTGNLDRQRETGSDNVPASGIATGTQQLAAGINVTTSAVISANSVTAQTVVLSALSVTVRGSLASIQVGSNVIVDTGTNQESVYVTAVNTTNKSITAIFTKSHASGVAAVSFAYNQARDSTAPDGSPAVGFAAGSMYLFNASLNSGVGGLEIERSAAGELDGANGAGTAVAAEYEFNAGGPMSGGAPSGLAFDRARNLQGKGMGATTSSAATSVGVTSITLTSVVGLLAGMQIRFDRNTATEEAGYVAATYVIGSLTVGLQSATAFAHASGAVAEWDIFASGGPGLSGFTPAGVGIDEEVLYDPVTKLYYIERAATQDNMPPQNVVVECLGLWNGTGFDRATGTTANGLLTKTSNGALETGGNLAALVAKVPTLGVQTAASSSSMSTAGVTLTQTSVVVTATSAQLIAANLSRKYLAWMVVGTADVTITPGATTAVAGAGRIYQSAGAGKQGAVEEFPAATPTNAFQIVAAATGSTVYIWEGV